MATKITANDVAEYETLLPLLTALYSEFKGLSGKKPEAVVSKGKVAVVNRLLNKLKALLAQERSIEYLDLLDEDSLPQMSDVTLTLSQYVAAMELFKTHHQKYDPTTYSTDWFFK